MNYFSHGMPCGAGGGWMFMGLWWIILIGIVWVVVMLVRRKESEKNQSKTPMDILKERYARGEISKQEFEEIKKDLV